MATIKEILDAIASQFPDDSKRDVFIELAEGRSSLCFYGDKYNNAVALLTAHMMTLADPNGLRAGGVAGPITGKKEGSLSVSFGGQSSNSKDSDLAQTSYGLQLEALRKGCGPFIGVTGGWDKPAALLGGTDAC